MNKKLWISVIVIVFVLIGIAVWKSTGSSAANDSHQYSQTLKHAGSDDSKQMKIQNREQRLQEDLSEQLQLLQRNPGNITQFLNDIKANCPLKACDTALTEALRNYPDQKFAQLVQSLLQRLPQYEQHMQSTVMSTSLPAKERFERLWQLREQTLGRDEAMLGFGQEREFANYRFAYAELQQNKNLSTAERLAAFEQLQQQYNNVTAQESNIARYEQAVALLNHQQLNAQSRLAEIQKLQQQYLSPEERVDMQFKAQRELQQQQHVDNYQQALQQLQQDMAPLKQQLSETEWQQQYQARLEQLRLKMFP